MNVFFAALRKDLLLAWRTRAQIFAVAAFGAVGLLLFSFAIGPNAALLKQNAAGFLWVALLFSTALTLGEGFRVETEQKAIEGLLLLPADARAMFYGKALATAAQLAAVGIAQLPFLVILYDAPPSALPPLTLVILLGCLAIAAPGTLYAAMSSQIRAQAVLLPLLLFPLVVPVLLAATKASALLLLGDPMSELSSWLMLLGIFTAVFWSLGGLLFGPILEG